MNGGHVTQRVRQGRRFGLADGPGVVAQCRDLTRQVLDEWFGPRGLLDSTAVGDALLLVSEVVTNACVHGGEPYELRFDRRDGRLWVGVSDRSSVRPRPDGPHRPARASGHGLYLLQKLSTAWGWMPTGQGKTVWFEIRVADTAGLAGSG
ncbi:ATP-binding protein [Streptomyces sp. NBC_00083]|uniref:ATP-binding protein n=1 Tax=Streptomyces sp. NBC_00083 TaxID=2975647 RepID=UPI00224CC936|nr:ATP-binding protein [Streptomyces sp. NBC_00083]MCX5384332.1 ATP-binding protein [Streptomyces sp. NBC_00083]